MSAFLTKLPNQATCCKLFYITALLIFKSRRSDISAEFTFIHGTSARAAVPEASSQPALLLIWEDEGELCTALALRVLAVSRARLCGVVGEWAGAGKEPESLAG